MKLRGFDRFHHEAANSIGRLGVFRALAPLGRMLAIVLPALAGPTPCAAQQGIGLTWNDCPAGVGNSSDYVFDCASNLDQEVLVCSFRLAQPTDSVIAIESVVDMQHSESVLPDWWRLGSGGCRAGNLSASADFSGLSACADPWNGNGFADIQQYEVGMPRGGANQVRILAVSWVPSLSAATLGAGILYYGVRIVVRNGNTVGLGACTGCGFGACLVLNSVLVRRLPGSSGDAYLQTPISGTSNQATWRGGAGADCAAVPARRATWGALKSLYR